MHPVLLKLGPFNIYSYGAMVALGFTVATFLAYRRAPIFGINKDCIVDCVILLLLSGIVGARALYVLLNAGYYAKYPAEILVLSKGGLVWYGGFASAIIAGLIFTKIKKFSFWDAADLMVPYVALGQAFGRIGCFLNGCCYGITAPSQFIFGERHPTQIYSAFLLLLIFVALFIWQGRRRFAGEIFAGYCILYSCKRFIIEFLRGDNARIFLGLTMSQLISLATLFAALVIFKMQADIWKKKGYSG